MTHCTGPCDQGRLPCPCPAACQFEDEPPEHNPLRVIVIDATIAALVVIVIAVIGWRVVG